jgi:hypothetical protein
VSRLAFLHPALIGMGLHVASARVARAVRGHRRYPGSATDILRAGLEDCWSGEYLTASPGHYRQFWTRDTGFAAASLVRLGGAWPGRLLSTLTWAIEVWRARGAHVTTTINPLLRWPVDIFDYGVDSLPLLLASLRALASSADPVVRDGAAALADEHRDWIAAEVEHFVERVVDPSTGLVRTDRVFSAHRDTFKNGSTAYANAMVALLARAVAETGWGPDLLSRHFARETAAEPGQPERTQSGRPESEPRSFVFAESDANPSFPPAMRVAVIPSEEGAEPGLRMQATDTATGMNTSLPQSGHANGAEDPVVRPDQGADRRFDWGILLRRHFWAGDRFRDRLGTDETSGEANIWPFWAGLVDDRDILRAALGTLSREGYATPVPLRFETSHRREGLLLTYRIWSPDYQTTTIWTSLGSIYLSLLKELDPDVAHKEIDRMRRLIERDGTFWEVLDGRMPAAAKAGGGGRSGDELPQPWRSRSGLSVSDQSMLWSAILLELID